ncbi:MAG: hypothetical protein Q8R15_04050 [Candidatus Micrarchaeota archaeon]|nr:hypothetical protein [Candidatus Micrarchaeota archaeon]
MEVIREKIVTVNEALSLLEQRQKEGNLSYEQQNTMNYLEDLSKLDSKDSEKMTKELKGAGLTEWQAVKVVDLMPKKEDELKVVLGGSGPLTEVVLKKVFEIAKEYRKLAKEPAKTRKVEAAPVVVEPVKTEDNSGEKPADEASEKIEE